jgi:L-ascorbate metabolism protein UlaG (beta-lactamase superfamily)
MKDKHMNPLEALNLQKELNIRTALGMHWGTFALGGDGQDEPLSDFEIAKKDFA